MLLTHSKTEFTDQRVTGESWAAFKTSGKCANGQVPVLEVGDRALNQSASILRFIGSQKGYYGPDPFDAHFADSIIDTFCDIEKGSPKGPEGKPLMYKMFGPDAINEEDVALMVGARTKQWETFATLLGDKTFFGGDSPSIADFWLCANLYSWERNTKGKESQAHVYAAMAAAFTDDAMVKWADVMGNELSDYIANRPGGSL